MKDQVVFITGSSSGIGQERAYRFSKASAKLVLTYNHGRSRGESAEKLCRRMSAQDTLRLHH